MFAGFPGHGGLILNGKQLFKVTTPPSEARSERSEVVRTYVNFFFGQQIICWGLSEMVFAGFSGHSGLI